MPDSQRLPVPPASMQGNPPGAVPYGEVLGKAFDKLTSQILIFLLAYTLLVIGLLVLAPNVPLEVRLMLYVIPPLGVLAYGWSRRRNLLRVRATVVKAGAQVFGERGAPSTASSGAVDVKSFWAGGRGTKVIGREYAGVKDEDPEDAQSRYLLELFQQLSSDDRQELVRHAMQLHTPKAPRA